MKALRVPLLMTAWISVPFDLEAERLYSNQGGALIRYDLPAGPATHLGHVTNAAHGVACSPRGLVYFSGLDGIVEQRDQEGRLLGTARLPGPNPPIATGLAFDSDGNLYINTWDPQSLVGGARVWRLRDGDPSALLEEVVPPFATRGWGLEVVPGGPHAGALLIVEVDEIMVGGRVLISEPPGAPVRVLIDRGAFPPQALPISIRANSCGQVFVSYLTALGAGIHRFDPEGRFLDSYASGFDHATSTDFDSHGNLYVADTFNGIGRIAPDRRVTLFASSISGVYSVAVCRDEPLRCAAGGPYRGECAGASTCLALSASPQRDCVTYRWTSDCPGADFGGTETSANPQLCLPLSSCPTRCKVSVVVRDGLREESCETEVHLEDTAPPRVASAPGDAVVECDAVPAPVEPRFEDECDAFPRVAFSEQRVDGRCPGEYELLRRWTASDSCGNESAAEQRVTVVDTTPPRVEPGAEDVRCLWPPDHRYVCFTTAELAPRAQEACSEPVSWRFAGCTSDQPDDADESDPRSAWGGDGHTAADCVVRSGGLELCARAERAGTGPGARAGRRYRFQAVASDNCGNESAPAVVGFLHVPHDRRGAVRACGPRRD